jgi:hypothetical protein
MKRLRHPIRAIREPFGTAGLIVAMVALVAALGGTALAGKDALTGKQKKEVTTIAKKFAGKPGAAGTAGTNGTNGTNGKDGVNGAAGKDGVNGKSVVVGSFTGADEENDEPAGEPCELNGGNEVEVEGSGVVDYTCNGAEGSEGSPWTLGGVLPSGKTESGVWSIGNVGNFESDPGKGKPVLESIAFPIRLEAAMAKSQVHLILSNGKEFTEAFSEVESTKCKGTAALPSAEPGNLCLYAGNTLAVLPETPGILMGPGLNSFRTPSNTAGAGVSGMVLKAFPQSNNSEAYGSWAVTAAP